MHANLDSYYPALLLEADFFMANEIVEYEYTGFAHVHKYTSTRYINTGNKTHDFLQDFHLFFYITIYSKMFPTFVIGIKMFPSF